MVSEGRPPCHRLGWLPWLVPSSALHEWHKIAAWRCAVKPGELCNWCSSSFQDPESPCNEKEVWSMPKVSEVPSILMDRVSKLWQMGWKRLQFLVLAWWWCNGLHDMLFSRWGVMLWVTSVESFSSGAFSWVAFNSHIARNFHAA